MSFLSGLGDIVGKGLQIGGLVTGNPGLAAAGKGIDDLTEGGGQAAAQFQQALNMQIASFASNELSNMQQMDEEAFKEMDET
ncbi:hypothetical protein [Pseudaestuariivita rosea]|uniref:hypothetical protein n=1 Tax=Pseudaestuariivita rosea TaxID=2763263 RepID=UPI001ABB92F1|nr:hypothetical protein [Pseudaestuariivita rosea]